MDFLYKKVADEIAGAIMKGTWKHGEKMPSVRTVISSYRVSMSTAVKVYYDLEARLFIEARPKSGYYVCYIPPQSRVATSNLIKTHTPASVDVMIKNVYDSLNDPRTVKLSVGVPATELLPISKMNKALMAATRSVTGSGTSYDTVEGNSRLRSLIAKRSFQWGGQLSEDDIIITSGCINAIAYSLMATTQPGDTIAIESPAYFGLLQLAKSLGLNVIELPSDPITGLELDALKKLIVAGKIDACLCVPNFNNPLGSCMPDKSKAALVSLLEDYGVPLIEDDLYGDLYFDKRPRTCKSFDKSGNVLWCSSVSKTLAPGYRVGWVAPGRYIEAVKKMKLFHVMANPSITQEAVALFWEANRYDKHLQKMRQVLQSNASRFVKTINEYFPAGTKVTNPSGGLVLWVELPSTVNATELYELALIEKISIAPGRIFTLGDQYNNCIRLNYALKWDKKVEDALKTIGALASQL